MQLQTHGAGVARLVPCTMSVGSTREIASFGTALDLTEVTNEAPKYANPTEETQYSTKNTTTGVTVQVAKSTKTIDAVSGSEVPPEGGADEIALSFMLTKAQKRTLVDMVRNKTVVAVAVGEGHEAETDANQGWSHLLGRISGDLEINNDEEITEVEVTIRGGEGFTLAGGVDELTYNTAMTTGTITPVGRDALTIAGIASGDLTNLKAGQIVDVDNA